MNLKDLTRLHGTAHIADVADVPISCVEKIRSGQVSPAMSVLSDVLLALCALYEMRPEDLDTLLEAAVRRNSNSDIERLIALRKAWPNLDVITTLEHIADQRSKRQKRRGSGHVETRGRSTG